MPGTNLARCHSRMTATAAGPAVSRTRAACLTCVAIVATAAPVFPAELQERTIQAYEVYAAAAERAFLQRSLRDLELARAGTPTLTLVHARPQPDPAADGRMAKVPGGIIHHWRGGIFIAGVDLDDVLAVSQAYDDYTRVHPRLVSSRLLSREGSRFRILTRVREDAGVVSAVLDVWSIVEYARGDGYAHALGRAHEIRQVRNAGQPDEVHLPAGRDSGYLWRVRTFTRFVERDGGVHVELETLALSRSFPPVLKWAIEPIARRLGRSSIERSLRELRSAVLQTR